MYPLKLTINPEGWHHFIRRKHDPNFRILQGKIWNRDQYTCQFCGFQAREFQEVVNLDHNYKNNVFKNMVTACCLCTQCFFISMIGQYNFGGGRLVYLPEITQQELNAFCHVIFCAITNETSYRDTAQTIYRDLKFRTQAIEDKYGSNTSQPSVFGQLIREFSVGEQDKLGDLFLKNFRLFPNIEKFKVQLSHWAQAAVAELKTA